MQEHATTETWRWLTLSNEVYCFTSRWQQISTGYRHKHPLTTIQGNKKNCLYRTKWVVPFNTPRSRCSRSSRPFWMIIMLLVFKKRHVSHHCWMLWNNSLQNIQTCALKQTTIIFINDFCRIFSWLIFQSIKFP